MSAALKPFPPRSTAKPTRDPAISIRGLRKFYGAIMLGRSARDARSYVGYLTQVFSLYHDLTVDENLRYIGEFRRLSDAQIEERSLRYLRMFGMVARFPELRLL